MKQQSRAPKAHMEKALARSLRRLPLVCAGGLPMRLVTQMGQYKEYAMSWLSLSQVARIQPRPVKDIGDASFWERGLVTFSLKLTEVTLCCCDNGMPQHALQVVIQLMQNTLLPLQCRKDSSAGVPGPSLGCLSHCELH